MIIPTKILLVLISQTSILVDAACNMFCNVPGPWVRQAHNIRYGAKDDDFATFKFTQNCHLYAIRLSHIKGALSDWRNGGGDYWSRWGHRKNKSTMKTIIVDPQQNKIWYPEGLTDAERGYNIKGFLSEDDVIVMKKTGNFSAGDNLQIWYSDDWFQLSSGSPELHDDGNHWVDVDVSCYV